MTAEVVYLCKFEGCRRAAMGAGQARCEDHRLRWLVGETPDPRPEWVRRAQSKGLPFRVTGGSAA